jgi:proteasome-associated ATPase
VDEAEAVLPPRGSRVSSDVDTTIVPTFLSEMDGFEGNNPFIILATNFKERIDEAIQRPGRIDLKIYIGRPTPEDCVEIFKIHLARTKVFGSPNKLANEATDYLFSIEKLVEQVSGALIETVVNLATENAIVRKINDRRITSGVTIEDIIFAVNHQ